MSGSNTERHYLLKQFVDVEQVRYKHHTIDVVDIHPKNILHLVPVYLAPGWGATTEVYRETILALAQTGRRVIAANTLPELLPAPVSVSGTGHRFPVVEWQRADMVIAVLKKKKIGPVDGIGHSESAFFLSLAAARNKKIFRNLVLVDPVAFAQKRSPIRMLWRSLKEFRFVRKKIQGDRVNPEHVRTSFRTHLRVLFASPRLHLSAGTTFLQSKLPIVLRKVKSRGHCIAIIHGTQDHLFPIEEIQNKVAKNSVDIFYPVEGAHSDLHLDHGKFIRMIDRALQELEDLYVQNENPIT